MIVVTCPCCGAHFRSKTRVRGLVTWRYPFTCPECGTGGHVSEGFAL